MQAFARILVATDFSAPSLRALDEVVEWAVVLDCSVLVMHAYQVSAVCAAIIGGNDLMEAIAWSADSELKRMVRTYAERGVHVEAVLRHGRPRDLILEVADQVHADLIVLGATGRRGAWNGLLHRNVATTLVRRARVPVMTIRGEVQRRVA